MLKRKLAFVLFFVFVSAQGFAQETFIIEGDTLQLQREVKGPLSLYFSEEGGKFRYFVQKGKRLVELTNERIEGIPRYKVQLEGFTSDADLSVHDVKFALYSLKHFANLYNKTVQADYEYNASSENVRERLGFFTGFSNNPYTDNPENILVPIIGVEFEFYDPNLAPRHSAFLHLRQSFERDVFRYSSTQLSLNYRFKVLRFENFDIHIDTELANFMYSTNTEEVKNDAGKTIGLDENSGFSFTAPLSFGVGSDIRITENSYISLNYNDFVSIVLDGNGNFPLDFSVGYKYNL